MRQNRRALQFLDDNWDPINNFCGIFKGNYFLEEQISFTPFKSKILNFLEDLYKKGNLIRFNTHFLNRSAHFITPGDKIIVIIDFEKECNLSKERIFKTLLEIAQEVDYEVPDHIRDIFLILSDFKNEFASFIQYNKIDRFYVLDSNIFNKRIEEWDYLIPSPSYCLDFAGKNNEIIEKGIEWYLQKGILIKSNIQNHLIKYIYVKEAEFICIIDYYGYNFLPILKDLDNFKGSFEEYNGLIIISGDYYGFLNEWIRINRDPKQITSAQQLKPWGIDWEKPVKKQIQVNYRQTKDLVDDIEPVILVNNYLVKNIFNTHGRAKKIFINDKVDLIDWEAADLYDYYGNYFRFIKSLQKGDVDTIYPKEAFAILLSRINNDCWPKLKYVLRLPFLNDSGELINTPGYIKEYQAFYPENFYLDINPMELHRDNLIWAKDLLIEYLQDFPFADPVDLTNILGLMVFSVMGPLIPPCRRPLWAVTASMSQTGKSLLVQAALTPAFGPFIHLTDSGKNEEMDKEIKACISAGDRYFVFDNVNSGSTFNNNWLLSNLTSPVIKFRVLVTHVREIHENNFLWILTGNNITFPKEGLNRLVSVRLLWNKDEAPEDRTGFLHSNILKWGWENRINIIKALFILIKNWIDQGKPEPQTAGLLNFPEIRKIGAILELAGFPGFGRLKKSVIKSDPEIEAFRACFQILYSQIGSESWSVRDLADIAFYNPLTQNEGPFDLIISDNKSGGRNISLGKLLKTYVDRPFLIEFNSEDINLILKKNPSGKVNYYTLIPQEIKGD